METKTKKYEELNKYERAMTNASIEQRLEAMANELKQMALALKISIHVDSTFHDWKASGDENETHSTVTVFFHKDNNCTGRDINGDGDLFGIIEEALAKKKEETD